MTQSCQKYSFGVDPITCHAWNKDKTQLALSLNNNEVEVQRVSGAQTTKTGELCEHGQRVTGIDWAPNSNRIVTCSADRNAYVWTPQQDGKWKPTLVILRINRAATCVKWSPQENKFAVGSGARVISVCYFEQDNDWWVSKQIRKPIRSTVTCLDWHPNNVLLACGSTDFKARVFSAYIKEVDVKPNSTNWGKKMTFGTMMAEFSNGGGGWVHSASFSGDGERLGWVGHDSSVSVADAANQMKMVTIKTQFLPFVTCTWVAPNSLLVAGHDCCPMIFLYDRSRGCVTFAGKVDNSKEATTEKFSAMKHFRHLDQWAVGQDENVTELDTQHQNTITQVSLYSGSKDKCSRFTTASTDGQLIVWDTESVVSAMDGLTLQ